MAAMLLSAGGYPKEENGEQAIHHGGEFYAGHKVVPRSQKWVSWVKKKMMGVEPREARKNNGPKV